MSKKKGKTPKVRTMVVDGVRWRYVPASTKKFLPAPYFYRLAMDALAFGGVGANRLYNVEFTPGNHLRARSVPWCIHGLRLHVAQSGRPRDRMDEPTRGFFSRGITYSLNDRMVGRTLRLNARTGRIPWPVYCAVTGLCPEK